MFGVCIDMLPGEAVPDMDIVACRGNALAIRGPRYGLDCTVVPTIRYDGTFLKLFITLKERHRPYLVPYGPYHLRLCVDHRATRRPYTQGL